MVKRTIKEGNTQGIEFDTAFVTKKTSFPAVESAVCRRVRKLYDQMWHAGIGKVRANQIEPDPFLADRKVDRRRGLTLIARPSAEVRKRVNKLLRDLRRLEPHQYYYVPSDIHLTVLSLFTAMTTPEPFFAEVEQYIAAADAALAAVPAIHIEFAGITASSAAILIQGFPRK